MTQLFNESELKNQTILRTQYSKGKLFLFFDNSFAVIRECSEDFVEIMGSKYNITPDVFNASELLKLGFIAAEEATKISTEFKKKNDELVKQNELKLLAELKTKYPNA
jgi:hypothetical protein